MLLLTAWVCVSAALVAAGIKTGNDALLGVGAVMVVMTCMIA